MLAYCIDETCFADDHGLNNVEVGTTERGQGVMFWGAGRFIETNKYFWVRQQTNTRAQMIDQIMVSVSYKSHYLRLSLYHYRTCTLLWSTSILAHSVS